MPERTPPRCAPSVAAACACLWLLGVPAAARAQAGGPAPAVSTLPAASGGLLDAVYRIDIETIAAAFDWYPACGWVDGAATIVFRMRPGQDRAAFDFTPFAAAHTLSLEYRLTVPSVYPRFSSEVNDILGRGNEAVWPTLNTPHELARHVLTFRVHDARPFRFVGTGRVESRAAAGVQQWVLDTQRAVSSYGVMFALLPEAGTDYREWLIDGVDVRALAYTGVNLAAARTALETWLPELGRRFGPFPAMHGLSLFLFGDAGGGMEYYGGAITSVSALRHEVLHSYFGCSVIARTHPDSWLDEAIVSWYEETSRGVSHAVLPEAYRGNWVGARPPASVGCSVLAYTDGASIMQEVANRLGGTDRMAEFLEFLVRTRSFVPLTTMDFVDDLEAYAGFDLRAKFLGWLYNGREPSTSDLRIDSEARRDWKTLDLDPAWAAREKR